MRSYRTATALLLLALLCALPAAAWGHAFPERCDPRVGSTVTVTPAEVKVWFDSELNQDLSKISVVDSQGKRMDRGSCCVDRSNLKLLKTGVSPLSPGVYRVYWEAVSKDGHRSTGNFKFVVK